MRAKAVGGGGMAAGAVKRLVAGRWGGLSTGCDARSGSLQRLVRRRSVAAHCFVWRSEIICRLHAGNESLIARLFCQRLIEGREPSVLKGIQGVGYLIQSFRWHIEANVPGLLIIGPDKNVKAVGI